MKKIREKQIIKKPKDAVIITDSSDPDGIKELKKSTYTQKKRLHIKKEEIPDDILKLMAS